MDKRQLFHFRGMVESRKLKKCKTNVCCWGRRNMILSIMIFEAQTNHKLHFKTISFCLLQQTHFRSGLALRIDQKNG
jgi:hypothetical protein